MKRSVFSKIVLLTLCLLMLVTVFPTGTEAAGNACKQISGSSKKAGSFLVQTGSRWYSSKDVLKLTQTKGTMNIMKVFSNKNSKGTRTMYELYDVTVERIVNNRVVSRTTYAWESGTLKIKLLRNSTYRVTVTSTFVKYNGKYPGGSLFNPYCTSTLIGNLTSIGWAPRGWKKHSTWKVASTSGILYCS